MVAACRPPRRLEVLLARAILALADAEVEPMALARVAQRAEHIAMGVPCGIQDQVSVVWGGVVGLDVRDGSVEVLSLPAATSVVVVDSGVARTLEGSPWVTYRAETLATADRLGVDVLRDVPLDHVATDRRARHVVTEIDRATRFIEAMRAGDPVAAGELMVASHRSSRDDFGSSTPELDLLVDELMVAGAHGARLTGGGFGGCVVALVPDARAEEISAAVVRIATAATGHAVQRAPRRTGPRCRRDHLTALTSCGGRRPIRRAPRRLASPTCVRAA